MSDAATRAVLVAGHAVAYATAYLDDRHDAKMLADNAERLLNDLLAIGDPATNPALDTTRILTIAMMRCARVALAQADGWMASSEARLERWQDIMGALVEIVRMDSGALRAALEVAEETRR